MEANISGGRGDIFFYHGYINHNLKNNQKAMWLSLKISTFCFCLSQDITQALEMLQQQYDNATALRLVLEANLTGKKSHNIA